MPGLERRHLIGGVCVTEEAWPGFNVSTTSYVMSSYADYRTPVGKLYQCGSATHPGGGVMGMGGHNAAREIVKDWSKWGPAAGLLSIPGQVRLRRAT